MRPALLGFAVGLAGAFGVTRVIASMFDGIDAHDPVTLLAAGAILLGAAAAACGVHVGDVVRSSWL